MFGSKLRSWMENHIGRPRKRGNKNKNNAGQNEALNKKEQQHTQQNGGNVVVTNTNTLSGHYGTNNGGNSNNITSPVRRREVSPIQNHSRYGWQSPDSENVISPKSDNFLYAPQQRVRAHQQQQQTTNKLIENKPPNGNSYHSSYQQQQQQPQQQLAQHNSSSSFSSLSWSTGSKEQNCHNIYNNEQRTNSHCLPPTPIITFHAPPENAINYDDHDNDDDDGVHYEEIQTILRQPHNLLVNRHQTLQERPKSEQLTSFGTPAYSRQHDLISSNYAKDDAGGVRYGKLLPSRIQQQQCNSGSGLLLGSAESLPCHSFQTQNAAADNNWQNRAPAAGVGHQQHNKQNYATAGTMPFHALSSPESAYSTGYSTDGHSPGACHNHPPEYYINMRTGTHYFPKSVNSLAIEAQRYKFGLNKIEEMSPIEPLPNVSFATPNQKMSNSSFYVSPKHSFPGMTASESQERRPVGSHSPLVLRNAIMLPTLHGFESSSPRQRCRIRTNPWYSTVETASSNGGMPSATSSSSIGVNAKQTVSTSATSSTLSSSKSSASNFGQSNILTSSNKGRQCSSNNGGEIINYASKDMYDSSSTEGSEDGKQHSTLSLTEVQARQRASNGNNNTNNGNTFRVKRANQHNKTAKMNGCGAGVGGVFSTSAQPPPPIMAPVVSDEDATLNEMMGKFDESYVYEKETDILSDSDATNCPSELDTGLDAEDECDTDELLDIDFIDTSSMKEVQFRKEICFNAWHEKSGNAAAHEISTATTTRMSRRSRHSQDLRAQDSSGDCGKPTIYPRRSGSSGSHRRRKRLIKTRKKNSTDCKENMMPLGSPLQQRSRETRSVGGTPISLRRNPTVSRERLKKASPMPARASSLIFHHDQLIKADMEADVKYRQLIEEAESILVSLKSSTQTLPRETPVSSPRRINPLVNKRVEMLKSFEGSRQMPQPQQQQQSQPQTQRSADLETDINAVLNKRIELLKHESSSAPNSPKCGSPRFSPSKTHITNFINQIDGQPRKPNSNEHQRISRNLNVPQANEANRLSRSPTPTSPLKTMALQNGKQNAKTLALPPMSDFDSDFELENNENHTKFLTYDAKAATSRKQDLANHNFLPEITRVLLRNGDALREDFVNHNNANNAGADKSMDNNCALAMPRFCPQSEPLKRKIYKGSQTFERLKFSFDLEAGRHAAGHHSIAAQPTLSNTSSQEFSLSQLSSFNKKQLLLDTLADLKQNLENQSVELNGLNAN